MSCRHMRSPVTDRLMPSNSAGVSLGCGQGIHAVPTESYPSGWPRLARGSGVPPGMPFFAPRKKKSMFFFFFLHSTF